jgi:ribosomal-protein-alanine N-acetyltransferase
MRCVEGRDAPAIAEMMTEAISKRLASWPVPFSPPMAEEKISSARGAAVQRRSLPLVLERKSDGAICGWVSLMCPPGEDRVALTTYWLGEQYQGQGLMREAGPVAVELAFKHMEIDYLRAAVQPDNAASLAVIRLLGFGPLGEGSIWCPGYRGNMPLVRKAPAAGAGLGRRGSTRQTGFSATGFRLKPDASS